MVTMPPGNKNEVWNLVLVRVPKDHLTQCAQRLSALAEPAQYAGAGWYIKRIELIQPKVATLKDPYSLAIAVKAGNQAAMDRALAEIDKVLRESSGGTATYDVYVVSGIQYHANW